MNSNENNEKDFADAPNERAFRGRGRGRPDRRFHARRLLKIPFIIAAILVKGAVVMWLWNALIPDIFHGPELIYPQALGLMILAKLLIGFGGFHFGGRGHWGHHRHGHWHRHDHWRRRKERWMQMSPEEREKLRAELKNRFRC